MLDLNVGAEAGLVPHLLSMLTKECNESLKLAGRNYGGSILLIVWMLGKFSPAVNGSFSSSLSGSDPRVAILNQLTTWQHWSRTESDTFAADFCLVEVEKSIILEELIEFLTFCQ